jgi:acetyltransferase-like isoleucine patch superfamily enzyme
VALSDVLPGNPALIRSLVFPDINRDEFYKELDKLPFDVVVKKYYPIDENSMKHKIKKRLKFIKSMLVKMGYHPKPYIQFFWMNFLRKNTQCVVRKGRFFFPARYSILDIHKQAHISINGSIFFGYKRIKGSKMESRLAVEENGSLTIESGNVSIFYGTDILVFKGANLTFKGNAMTNQRVQIICMDNITIGDGVMISRDVVIRDNDGGHEILREGYKKTAPVTIGNHVWIGQGAIILKGVTIGDGAIIAAGALVTTHVMPKAVIMSDHARTVQNNIEWRQ